MKTIDACPAKEPVTYSKRALLTFFTAVFWLTAVLETIICIDKLNGLLLILMWVPGFSAILAILYTGIYQRKPISIHAIFTLTGFHKCKKSYILLAIALPLIYILVPYLIYWWMKPQSFTTGGVPMHTLLISTLVKMVVGVFLNILVTSGEEIGWRGFMQPGLTEQIGLKKAILATSTFWVVWHLPVLIFGDYMSGAALYYQIPAFILCILPVGIIVGILTYRSGSVWPAIFLHSAHNNFDQAVFGAMTTSDQKMYFVSETGCLTIACAWIIAIYMMCKYFPKEPNSIA
ncbi:MAG: CPBP family intramembrane metalloprotease [Lachnospiraceae bacterium]|nr:CPBP family intramembrane metalloprotease [Lachnospiraceae bacterium]